MRLITHNLACTLAGALTVFLASGCLIFGTRGSGGSSGKSCPPGHVWSDGQCHDKGKGHDPNKHPGKGKGNGNGRRQAWR